MIHFHVDTVTYFSFQGNVYDEQTKNPLSKVQVVFVDTGFDSVRSQRDFSKEVGKSDHLGKIDLTLGYWWGTEIGPFAKRPRKTFEVLLSKEGYRSERFSFKADDLPKKEEWLQVFLDEIYLEPNQVK